MTPPPGDIDAPGYLIMPFLSRAAVGSGGRPAGGLGASWGWPGGDSEGELGVAWGRLCGRPGGGLVGEQRRPKVAILWTSWGQPGDSPVDQVGQPEVAIWVT